MEIDCSGLRGREILALTINQEYLGGMETQIRAGKGSADAEISVAVHPAFLIQGARQRPSVSWVPRLRPSVLWVKIICDFFDPKTRTKKVRKIWDAVKLTLPGWLHLSFRSTLPIWERREQLLRTCSRTMANVRQFPTYLRSRIPASLPFGIKARLVCLPGTCNMPAS